MKKLKIPAIMIAVLLFGAGSYFAGVYTTQISQKPIDMLSAASIKLIPDKLDATKSEALVNEVRVREGLQPLAHNEKLEDSACMKLDDMVAKDYWAHVSPDGIEPWHWFDESGYKYTKAGENLVYGYSTEQAAVIAWTNSPKHRENILGSYTEQAICSGVAYYQGKYNTILVNHFGNVE